MTVSRWAWGHRHTQTYGYTREVWEMWPHAGRHGPADRGNQSANTQAHDI